MANLYDYFKINVMAKFLHKVCIMQIIYIFFVYIHLILEFERRFPKQIFQNPVISEER